MWIDRQCLPVTLLNSQKIGRRSVLVVSATYPRPEKRLGQVLFLTFLSVKRAEWHILTRTMRGGSRAARSTEAARGNRLETYRAYKRKLFPNPQSLSFFRSRNG